MNTPMKKERPAGTYDALYPVPPKRNIPTIAVAAPKRQGIVKRWLRNPESFLADLTCFVLIAAMLFYIPYTDWYQTGQSLVIRFVQGVL